MLSAGRAAHIAEDDLLDLDAASDHGQQRLRSLRKNKDLFSGGRIFLQIGGGICLIHDLQLHILGCSRKQDPLQERV